MKTPRCRPGRIFSTFCAAAALALGGAQAANVTWTNTAYGDWSDGTNWSTNPSTPASGDLIFFDLANGAASFNTGMNISDPFAVNGLRLTTGTGVNTVSIFAGALATGGTAAPSTSATLQIGSGGITATPGSTSNGAGYFVIGGGMAYNGNNLTVETTADQDWISNGNGFNNGRITIAANLTGSGQITVSGSGGPIQFATGTTSGFTGNFVLNSGAIRLVGASQIGRLGPNALTIQSGGSGTGTPTLNFADMSYTNQTHTFSNDIVFQDTDTRSPQITMDASSVTGTAALAFTGNWSGALNDGLTLNSSRSDVLIRLQQSAGTLTSTKTGGVQLSSAIFLRAGVFSVENANALGSGNSLTLSIGQNGADGSNFNLLTNSLLTINGVNVGSNIWVNANYRQTADSARGAIVTLGLQGSGASTYSGDVSLESLTKTQTEGASTNRLANAKLSAESGGKVTFSGTIKDTSVHATDRNYASVTVLGGGKVELSGSNTYRGGTSVIAGTTLLANGTSGSSTGDGNVYIGWAANSFNGTLTSGQSYITSVSSLSGLVVGQTITGTGIDAGTTITYIDPTRNRIEISSKATGSGNTSLATDSATGILGGSGHIRPGVVNGTDQKITVAAGSSIAPGNSIGTLVLDGGGTSASLLTMATGSTFSFELGAGDTSDQVSFWNYASGDFALNNNTINFSDAQTGTYTLFTFFSDDGSTATASGISSGLVVGTGLEGYTYELKYNTNSITLEVVPEPATCLLVGLGLVPVLWSRRRRA